ncbi:hypothetical protein [Tessaracoccus sp.]
MEIHFTLNTAGATDRKALAALAAVYGPDAPSVPGANARGLTPSMANGDAAALDSVGPEDSEEITVGDPAVMAAVEKVHQDALEAAANSEEEKPRRTRRTKAQMEADRAAAEAQAAAVAAAEEPEEEAAEETQENVLEADAEEDDVLGTGPTLEDAVKAAGALLNEGRKDDVLKVLATFKAPRVSNLAPDQLGPFIQALKALPAK